MSTRRAGVYQWDHGAQYFSPKTEQFARAVDEWCANGWCDVWDGDHCVWSAEAGVSRDPKASGVKRYVGRPGMNAICKGLLAGIDARFETRAAARRNPRGGWRLENAKTGAPLGDFDLVICTDKTAAALHRQDLDREHLDAFVRPAAAVRSHPSLALLVATQPTGLAFDSLLLEDHPHFAWLSRDDSKPGRQRSDGAECWLAHASAQVTGRLVAASKQSRGKSRPHALRAAIVRELLPSFEALLADLHPGSAKAELGGGEAKGGTSEVLLAQGHRWGAAFPLAPLDGGDRFYLDREGAFAACGDYFTPFPGRVEGAWISGSSLADALLAVVE